MGGGEGNCLGGGGVFIDYPPLPPPKNTPKIPRLLQLHPKVTILVTAKLLISRQKIGLLYIIYLFTNIYIYIRAYLYIYYMCVYMFEKIGNQ